MNIVFNFLLTLIILTVSTNSLAQNATLLDIGESAPYKGVLITEDKAKELYKAEKSNIVLKDLQIANEELIEFHKDNSKRAHQELSKAKFNAFWTNTGYFFLGVVLASVAFKVTMEINR